MDSTKKKTRTRATQLPVVNCQAMKDRPRLDRGQHAQLLAPVSSEEMIHALERINDNKATGCDDFNAYYFNKKIIKFLKNQLNL